jgi:heptosyltransferase I
MIKAICLVRLSALGDVLMVVPLVRTLQAHLPQVQITWVISRPAYDLVEGMEGVEFIVIDKPKGLQGYWRFKKMLKGRHFDVLLAAQASFRANLLYPLISATRKIGYDTLRAKDLHGWFITESIPPGRDHTLDGFLKFATLLGIQNPSITWDLSIAKADYDWALKHLPKERPILAINPAASKPERSWPVDSYISLIKEAKAKWNVQIVLTGGPGDYDKALADEITQAVEVCNLVGKTKPKQLLALLSLVDGLVCPDTGPSHMATAVSTPVIALHAVTGSAVSGPYTWRHLAVDYYPQAVAQFLKSTVEKTPWGMHVHGPETMRLIPVHEVMKKLEMLLKSHTPS